MRKVGDAFVVGGNGVKGLTQSLKLSGKAFLALGKEMLAIYAPMLAIEVVATLIGKLIDHYDTAKKAEEAANAWEEVKTELSEVKSELESVQEKIDEIKSKGQLSLTDKDELKQLQLENAELERRQALLEKEEKEKAKESSKANLDNVKSYTKLAPGSDTQEKLKAKGQVGEEELAQYGDITQQIDSYAALLEKTRDQFLKVSAEEHPDQDQLTKLSEQVDAYESKILELVRIIEDNPVDLQYAEGDPLAEKLESAYNTGLLAVNAISSVEAIALSAGVEVEDLNKKMMNIAKTGELPEDNDTLLASLGLTQENLDKAGVTIDGLRDHISSLTTLDDVFNANMNDDVQQKLDALISSDDDFTMDGVVEALGKDFVNAIKRADKKIDDSDILEYLDNLRDSSKKMDFDSSIEDLSDLSSRFDILTEAYQNFSEEGAAGIDLNTLEELGTLFSNFQDTDEFNNIIKVLNDSSASLSDVEAAFNKLMDAYVKGTGYLDGITEANKDLYVQRLKNMGVTNAAEVAESTLAKSVLNNADATYQELQVAWQSIGVKNALTEAQYNNIAATVDAATRMDFLKAIEAQIAGSNFAEVMSAHSQSILAVGAAANMSISGLENYFNALATVSNAQQALKEGKGNPIGASIALANAKASLKIAQEEYNNILGTFTMPEVKYSPTSSSVYKDSSSSGASSDSKTNFDWIEVAISRIERAISNLDKQVNNTFKSWSSRNSNLVKELNKVKEEITLQEQAYDAYMREANAIGLSSYWVNKIKNGSLNISVLTDKDLIEKIQNYQDWYEKALACKDAIDDLKIDESELFKQKFDNIITRYDGYLSMIEHEQAMLEAAITDTETRGYLVSATYYDKLIEQENSKISQIKAERAQLIQTLNEGIADGFITKNSEEWYNLMSQINDTTEAIQEGETAIVEYGNAIRDLEWEVFDLLQTNISDITNEADFLIDLLGSKELYDDKGQLTDAGMSTMGLHGVNYNVAMAQADEYAHELAEINEQLAHDPKELLMAISGAIVP